MELEDVVGSFAVLLVSRPVFGLAVFGAVTCRPAAGTIGKENIRFAADRTFGSRSHFDSIVSAGRGGRRLAGGIQCVINTV